MRRLTHFRRLLLAASLAFGASTIGAAHAGPAESPGITPDEIVLGQTMPYSGPLSAFGTQGRTHAAYFKMVNDAGGVNGRKIRLISLDDGFSPPKTVEQVRKLVELDNVALMFASLGTPTNAAVQKYLNAKKVPAIFIGSGATRFYNPQEFPWTLPFVPNVVSEATIYGKYIKSSPDSNDSKIGILFQNDDFGRDFVTGLKKGLGSDADKMIVLQVSYQPTDPTIDSQIVALRAAGANVFVNASGPKFAAQAIRKVAEIGWKPLHILSSSGSSLAGAIIPAGPQNAIGVISVTYLKDPNDQRWQNDPGVQAYRTFMAKYYPEGDLSDNSNVYAYTTAEAFINVVKRAGGDLSRDNLMKQFTNIDDMALSMLVPDVRLRTSPEQYGPIARQQVVRFDGKAWEPIGDVIGE
ncbi:ABC transporter substrate-binding protein [Bradyrhizobium liaoningense]